MANAQFSFGGNRSDMKAGLPLFAFGAALFAASWTYEIGELRRMGPGYFPMLLGAVLCIFALLIVLEDGRKRLARARRVARPETPAVRLGEVWRPVVLPLAAVVLFAALLETAGLFPAVVACVAAAGFAETGNRLPTVLVIAIATAIFVSAVFVYALGIPLRLFVL